MDSSMMSSTTADTSTPTPIMNLAGLSIYNVQRESTDPMNLPRPIQIDRKWTKDSGKIERRYDIFIFMDTSFCVSYAKLVFLWLKHKNVALFLFCMVESPTLGIGTSALATKHDKLVPAAF